MMLKIVLLMVLVFKNYYIVAVVKDNDCFFLSYFQADKLFYKQAPLPKIYLAETYDTLSILSSIKNNNFAIIARSKIKLHPTRTFHKSSDPDLHFQLEFNDKEMRFYIKIISNPSESKYLAKKLMKIPYIKTEGFICKIE